MENGRAKKSLVICGATAVGKSEIAQIVAEKLDGEIISADSRQIYKELDIGTAKPLDTRIRHHLIDIIEPTEKFDSMKFVRLSLEAMEEIRGRGKLPIIVGGTGLYIRALTEGIFTGDFYNENIRKNLRQRWEKGENLYDELRRVDPKAASKIDPNNYVRIERALEVFLVSGKPISYWWQNETKPPSEWKFVKILLSVERELLYRRIEKRTRKMLESGWVDEVKNLLRRGLSPDCPGLSSIGYRQIVEFTRGEIPYGEMFESIVRETKHYAKRQIVWFKKEPNIIRIDITNLEPIIAADKIITCFLEK